MHKKYLAIFDLDGTLFDTSEVNYYAYREALHSFKIELDKDYFVKNCNGRHYMEFLPEIMGNIDHIEDVHKLKKMAYAMNLDKARKNTHLFKLINIMKEIYYISLVTTASKKNTEDILSYFKCKSFFDHIIAQEDIIKVKPDPQGFLLAMEYFNMAPEKTIIFEDSDVGIRAARATGATVVIVDQF